MTEIEHLESKIRSEREEVSALRRKAKNDELAKETREIYESLVDAGFTEEQAFDLFMVMIKKAFENS